MSITIVENRKPKNTKIHFTVDDPISKELSKYPMVDDCLNRYRSTLIIGRQGQGKTSLTINWVKHLFRKKFNKIFLVMPDYSAQSLSNNIFDKLPDDRKYSELNLNTINEIYERIKENRDNDESTLLILDDVQDALKLVPIVRIFKKLVANQRHLKLSIICLLQNFLSLDKQIRKLFHNIVFFKLDKAETETIYEEVMQIPRNMYYDVQDVLFNDVHDWCMYNTRNGKIYKMYDEVIINK